MLRKFALALLIVTSTCLVAGVASAAPMISPNNPYRSFNLSGVNYGSLKWEQTHGNSRTRSMNNGGARLFRRR